MELDSSNSTLADMSSEEINHGLSLNFDHRDESSFYIAKSDDGTGLAPFERNLRVPDGPRISDVTDDDFWTHSLTATGHVYARQGAEVCVGRIPKDTFGSRRAPGHVATAFEASKEMTNGREDDFSDFIDYDPQPTSPTPYCHITAPVPLLDSRLQRYAPCHLSNAAMSMSDYHDVPNSQGSFPEDMPIYVSPSTVSTQGISQTVKNVPLDLTVSLIGAKSTLISAREAAESSRRLDVEAESQGPQVVERASVRRERAVVAYAYGTKARETVKEASKHRPSGPYARYFAPENSVEARMLKLIRAFEAVCTQPVVGSYSGTAKRRSKKRGNFRTGLKALVSSLEVDPKSKRAFAMWRLERLENLQRELGL